MTTAEAWDHAAEVAAALREGRPVSDEDAALHDRLWPQWLWPPDRLGDAGRRLWFELTDDAEDLDARSMHYLERACRCADEIALLEAAVDRDGTTIVGSRGQSIVHPAIAEARQLRLVELRLLRQIDFGPEDEPEETPARRRARHAANVRWNRKRDVLALRAEIRSRSVRRAT